MEARIFISLFIFYTLALLCKPLYSDKKSIGNLLSLTATNTWKEYGLESTSAASKKEKGVWISSITLKSKEAFKLKKFKIQWVGERIDDLSAALFVKKRSEPSVIPIEKNLICDGIWDQRNQQIIFFLNEKIIATNKYHLVLSFPQKLESNLKKGKFILSKQNSFHAYPSSK